MNSRDESDVVMEREISCDVKKVKNKPKVNRSKNSENHKKLKNDEIIRENVDRDFYDSDFKFESDFEKTFNNNSKLHGKDALLSETINLDSDDSVAQFSSTSTIKDTPKVKEDKIDDDVAKTSHRIRVSKKNGKTVKEYQCGICLKIFPHQYTLTRHLPVHTNVRNFKCDECGKAFRQLSTLSQHKAIHSVERPHTCDVCLKCFNRVSTLISHRKTHLGLKPYQCHLCNKGFHQKGNLQNHIFTHTNARPYRCSLCDKGFNQMSNLMCHAQKSHAGEINLFWNCDRCDKSFEKRAQLRAHEFQIHCMKDQNSRNKLQDKAPQCAASPQNEFTVQQNFQQDKDNVPRGYSEISKTRIAIDAIDTEAMRQVRSRNEIPFAVLHFSEAPPSLVRVVDGGDHSLLCPMNPEEFISSEDLKAHKKIHLNIPIVATIYHSLNEFGQSEFAAVPPLDAYKFAEYKPTTNLNQTVSLSLHLPDDLQNLPPNSQSSCSENCPQSDLNLENPVLKKSLLDNLTESFTNSGSSTEALNIQYVDELSDKDFKETDINTVKEEILFSAQIAGTQSFNGDSEANICKIEKSDSFSKSQEDSNCGTDGVLPSELSDSPCTTTKSVLEPDLSDFYSDLTTDENIENIQLLLSNDVNSIFHISDEFLLANQFCEEI